jgi:hypothetical protein
MKRGSSSVRSGGGWLGCGSICLIERVTILMLREGDKHGTSAATEY